MAPTDTDRTPIDPTPVPGKALTIGAVCKQLEREFPEISISKIRYLGCSPRVAPPAATGCSRPPTSRGCARSCASSATSSCRCG